jgi:flagellar basal-body rod modification protein FlgD
MQLPLLGGLFSSKDAPGPESLPSTAAAVKTSAEATSSSGGTDSSGSSSSSSGSSSITANDFLTLLVAEMKNQDPTSSTDPNEYIDQLVQVNSLQQLISINQELAPSSSSGSSGSGSSGSGSSSSSQATPVAASSAPAGTLAASSSEGLAVRHGVPLGTVSAQARIAASAARVAEALTPPADASQSGDPGQAQPSQLQKFSLAARGGLAMQPSFRP